MFFKFCIQEIQYADVWIDQEFATSLHALCDPSLVNVPYRTLCRSIFDVDPAAMFLSLYRCLEAIYALTSSRKMMASLALIQSSWENVACVLEEKLGWYPRAEIALQELMAYINDYDAKALICGLGEPLPTACDFKQVAGKRIYAVRNGLVHYRPVHRTLSYERVDWNRTCQAVASMVCCIYDSIAPSYEQP